MFFTILFYNFFTIPSLLRSLIVYLHGTIFLTFLIPKLLQINLEYSLLQKYFHILIFLHDHHDSYILTWYWIYISRLHFNGSMTRIFVFINYVIYIHIFRYWSHIFINLFFRVLTNLSVTTDFPSLCVEYISMSFFSSHNFIYLLENPLSLSTHILFSLKFLFLKILLKFEIIVLLILY